MQYCPGKPGRKINKLLKISLKMLSIVGGGGYIVSAEDA